MRNKKVKKPSEFLKKIKESHQKLTLKKALALFWMFFRIGLFTFGGGYAMLPIIQKEIIEKKKWITDPELMDILVISESTPGPVAVNTATYVGYRMGGVLGSLISTLALTIPSFVIIFVISLFFDKFIAITWIKHAFTGIQAAVAVLIISAAIKLFKKMKKTAIFCIITSCVAILSMTFKFTNINFSSIYFIIIGFSISGCLTLTTMEKQLLKEESELDYSFKLGESL